MSKKVKDPSLPQEWLVKIRRDVGPHFKLTEATKVCSLYFHPSDVKKGIGGKKWLYVKELLPMAMYGYVWLCTAMYGYVGLCMAMYGYVWLCMAM